MLEDVAGLDETDARNMLRHGLAQQGEDPLVLKALSHPNAQAPAATLQDAINIYSRERVKDDKDKATRLDRIVSRMEHVMGSPREMKLDDLRRSHGIWFVTTFSKTIAKPTARSSQ
ncbi:hypothetical protein [Falsiphaeobacter marinintestinus]|uniref:hypothetical protein n=1 Tax=Falsiphaeobacter marinintestinus TaxID=1492905 RepID=UPI0011B5F600|nr:hypothetical protein [Phaeobacter marinintestinus]